MRLRETQRTSRRPGVARRTVTSGGGGDKPHDRDALSAESQSAADGLSPEEALEQCRVSS